MENEEKQVLQFIPALVIILKAEEDKKGAPLTEAEVLAIRDKAVCMVMPLSAAEALNRSRGYSDIDPEQCWEEWCEARTQF